ncbi:unnamed protein product [Schistocephalus solidus]|uniref:Secreted protein n=1 Tax=Schistocephalus solidus TaxID=70667 RepID=A0A183SYU7_SCHSO|nr:unnamed protein product [Schistocephalus solidus]
MGWRRSVQTMSAAGGIALVQLPPAGVTRSPPSDELPQFRQTTLSQHGGMASQPATTAFLTATVRD